MKRLFFCLLLVSKLFAQSVTITSPASDGLTVSNPGGTFSWNAYPNAISYDVFIIQDMNSFDPNSTKIPYYSLTTSGTSISSFPYYLGDGMDLTFVVTPKYVDGRSDYAATGRRKFKNYSVRPTASIPTLISPAYDETGILVSAPFTFKWSEASTKIMYAGADYDLRNMYITSYIFTIYDGTSIVYTKTIYAGSNLYLPATHQETVSGILSRNRTYTWTVQTKDEFGTMGTSTTGRFYTEKTPAPIAPTLLRPINNIEVSYLTPMLEWSGVSYATSYYYELCEVSSNTIISSGYNDYLTIYAQLTSPLKYDTQYKWKVKASNPTGDGTSAWAYFKTLKAPTTEPPKVAPSTPVGISPNNGEVSSPYLFTWNKSTGINPKYSILVKWHNDPVGINAYTYDTTYSWTTSQLIEGETYTWMVSAGNDYGQSAWSSPKVFTVYKKPPVVETPKAVIAVLTSPVNGASNISLTPTLKWTVTDPTITMFKYEIYLNSSLVTSGYTPSNVSYVVIPSGYLNYYTSYQWRVTTTNQAGDGVSDYFTFRTLIEPSIPPVTTTLRTPLLISPEGGIINFTLPCLFKWHKVTNATSYVFEMYNTSNDAQVISPVTLTDTTYNLTSIASPTTNYKWRVQARTSTLASAWSQRLLSTTTVVPTLPSKPSTPTRVAPSAGTQNLEFPYLFKWRKSVNASSYNLQILKNADVNSIAYDYKGVSDTSYNVIVLDYSTYYGYRVNASNSAGTSAWSDVGVFTTKAKPIVLPNDPPKPPDPGKPADPVVVVTTPILIYPLNTINMTAPFTFKWHKVIGATSYLMTLYDPLTGYNVGGGVPTVQGDTTIYWVYNLGINKRYKWTLYAWNSVSKSEVAVSYFTSTTDTTYNPTHLNPPILMSPTDKDTILAPITFKWHKATGATTYLLDVKNLTTGKSYCQIATSNTVLIPTGSGGMDLMSGAKYSWRVISGNPGFSGSYSPSRYFYGKNISSQGQDTNFVAGTGDFGDPYLIANAYQLRNIRWGGYGKYYKLVNDIDMSVLPDVDVHHSNWISIYRGQIFFDGNGKTIRNMKQYGRGGDTRQGLFGTLVNGWCKNLRVSNFQIIDTTTATYQNFAAFIVAEGGGKLTRIVIDSSRIFLRSPNDINLSAGGLVGLRQATENDSIFRCSVSNSSIITEGNTNDGGNMVATGALIGYLSNGKYIGQCFANNVLVQGRRGVSASSMIGAFIGHVEASFTRAILEDCYFKGRVNVNVSSAGGIVGFVQGIATSNLTTRRCYAVTTNLNPNIAFKSGWTGRNYNTFNSYFDKDIIGTSKSASLYSTTDTSIAKTTTQMKTQSSYNTWDFTSVGAWGISPLFNDGYPSLRWAPAFYLRLTAPLTEDVYRVGDKIRISWQSNFDTIQVVSPINIKVATNKAQYIDVDAPNTSGMIFVKIKDVYGLASDSTYFTVLGANQKRIKIKRVSYNRDPITIGDTISIKTASYDVRKISYFWAHDTLSTWKTLGMDSVRSNNSYLDKEGNLVNQGADTTITSFKILDKSMASGLIYIKVIGNTTFGQGDTIIKVMGGGSLVPYPGQNCYHYKIRSKVSEENGKVVGLFVETQWVRDVSCGWNPAFHWRDVGKSNTFLVGNAPVVNWSKQTYTCCTEPDPLNPGGSRQCVSDKLMPFRDCYYPLETDPAFLFDGNGIMPMFGSFNGWKYIPSYDAKSQNFTIYAYNLVTKKRYISFRVGSNVLTGWSFYGGYAFGSMKALITYSNGTGGLILAQDSGYPVFMSFSVLPKVVELEDVQDIYGGTITVQKGKEIKYNAFRGIHPKIWKWGVRSGVKP